MVEVANALKEWTESIGALWKLGDSVVRWARPFGTDFERAWEECDRADHLVALGALGQIDVVVVHRHASSIAAGVAPLAQEHAAVLAPMAEAATRWQRGAPLPSDLGDTHERLARALRSASAAATQDEERVGPALALRLAASVDVSRALPDDEAVGLLVAALDAPAHLKSLRSLFEARYRRALAQSALQALSGALLLSKLAETALSDRALLRSPRVARSTYAMDIAHRLVGTEALVCAVAAQVFRSASRVEAWSEAASDRVWQGAVKAFVAQRESFQDPAHTFECLELSLVREVDKVASRRLEALANALRTDVPLWCLSFPPDDDPEEAPTVRISRAAMRETFERLRLFAATTDDAALREATEATLLVLRTPSLLCRPALVPLVEHTRAALGRALGDTLEAREVEPVRARLDAKMRAYCDWLRREVALVD